ncbi:MULTISPECIES: hypothetical protein [Streptomyces]|uniref:Uncharacterized protein n=1 Tax=Streptomyces sviceus (strain ATCC 29083 / DSM 924 / JCM 4929 / NBRC 13980 / NCIMB 11184 / NRRL 5439 / UC 5370) TaxID=463191 RepID=B5HTQ3_STRX2|nr:MULTISPECIES: hypothetical protein [Streptomyces]EDY56185.1 conserved hypothetical protein [Streptomyces sviceus ATCC 29083]MYT07157.1 hypothetical protein [Streptomyces sp. SID5470]
MGKPASQKDRGKGSSFSLSYEGAQRDPANHITVGTGGFSFKGSTKALIALAVLAVAGSAAYLALSGQGQGDPSGASVAPSTSTSAASGGAAAADAMKSDPPTSPTPGVTQAAGAEPTAVRTRRKVVLRSGSNVDLDFTNGQSDIIFSLPANADDGYTIVGENGDLATVNGPATAESCAAATDFGFAIDQKNISRGLTACVLTDENRVAAITVLGWQADDANYAGGLSSVTMDVTTWEKPEGAA